MAVQVKVRLLSSIPPPVPLILVKVAMLVLVTLERITALGGLPYGSVHCQLNLPSPATVQERVRFEERLAASSLAGEEGGGICGHHSWKGEREQLLYGLSAIIMLTARLPVHAGWLRHTTVL